MILIQQNLDNSDVGKLRRQFNMNKYKVIQVGSKESKKESVHKCACCMLLQVEPDALFQLLLALSQKCSDDLQILDLVEGDKPLMPLVCFCQVVTIMYVN